MRSIEALIERVILGSRWVLVVFNFGLAAALVLYAFSFILKFIKVASGVFVLDESEMILSMLSLIDATLVASLLLMVMVSSYENYVSRLDNADVQLSWLGKLDAGSLKIKVASSIVAISSIHLLQIFLNADSYDNMKIMWFVVLHLTFVISALLLGVLDRISAKGDSHGKP
ncbi:TIGR00645 family protein [Mesorhizobium sp. BR1-1-16]|uniref:TIGR00645 family protein n=1 Tax=Mesorhizobium sp. BR1-1-16 TaxID=2876653 RepID=UPI001CCBC55B|nr:TIGR00645 family protein [Mesorhizobium sp. BR1-1-16]MBZ9937656.1 TIGR00645 family protein [Mesorhizobium sp. BR1-1-16]